MSMQDPIADLFSRLNNAQARQKTSLVVPSSKFKISLMTLLQNKGYIESINVTDNDKPENLVNLFKSWISKFNSFIIISLTSF